MNLSLKAHQPMPVIVAGNWIYLETALQSITLESALGDRVTLKKEAVVKSTQQIGRVLVYSDIDQNITLEFGFGDFVPPANISGQSIVVSDMPAVELAAGQSVNIGQMPAVELAEGQALSIAQMPALEIAAGQSVSLDSLPKVEIAPSQTVNIGELPNITFASGQSIRIEQMPAVELVSGQEITTRMSNELNAHSSIMPFVLAANSRRRKVHIKAASENTHPILIAGIYPLVAGEKIELSTQAEIEFTGDVADSVQILEV